VQFTATSPYVFDQSNDQSTFLIGETITSGSSLQQNASVYVWDPSLGTISGQITDDATNSSLFGVSVALEDMSGSVIQSSVTGSDGSYSFINLQPAQYQLSFSAPTGYVFDQSSAASTWVTTETVAAGQILTQNASAYQPGSLGGQVINDETAGGLAGVPVNLVADGVTIATTVTDTTGDYNFPDLPAATYLLEFSAPSGYQFDQSNGAVSWNVTETTGFGPVVQNASAYLSGMPPASIAGCVTDDATGGGLAGVTVEVSDHAGNVVDTSTTDASGNYTFADLSAGNYSLQFIAPGDFIFDPSGVASWSSSVTVVTGQTATQSVSASEPATINGQVTDDGASGSGLAGVTIQAYLAGTYIQTAVTDDSGNYSLDGIPAGNYTLTFTAPSGYLFDQSDGGSTWSPSFTLTSAQTLTENASAYQVAGTVTGQVVDETGTGVSGATVYLTDSSGNVLPPTMTDSQGNYVLSASPGDYTLTFVVPSTYDFNGSVPSSTWSTDVTLLADDSVERVAQVYHPGSVGGQVTDDATGEGLAGVTVVLANSQGNTVATATTTFDGDYLFTGLVSDAYTVTFTAPGDYLFDNSSTATWSVTDEVAYGTTTTQNASAAEPGATEGAITGQVTDDTTNRGLAGVTVALEDASGNPITTKTTAFDGTVQFGDLAQGNYTLVFTAPESVGPGGLTSIFGNPQSYVFDQSSGQSTWTDQVTVTPGQTTVVSASAYPVGTPLGSVVGTVIDDGTGSGLAGASVLLTDPNGNLIGQVTTDTSGAYSFTGLTTGDDTLRVEAPPPYLIDQNAGSSIWDVNEPVRTGSTITQNILTYQPASLSGMVTFGGSGLVGVTITLKDSGGNLIGQGPPGLLTPPGLGAPGDSSGNTIDQTSTDTDGSFSLFDLAPGADTLEIDAPFGYAFSDGRTVERISETISSAADITIPSIALSLLPGSVSGQVIDDSTGLGVSGTSVDVTDAYGNSVGTAITDPGGNYSITGLSAGDDTLTFSANGYVFDQAGTASSTWSTPVTIAAGTEAVQGASVYQLGSLSGQITDDGTGSGLAGVNVTLADIAGNPISSIPPVVTDASGTYSFVSLQPGAYTLEFTAPSQYVFDQSGAATWAPVASVSSAGGEVLDASALQPGISPGAIAGIVTDDASSQGLEGVTVNVTNSNGVNVLTTTTDAQGEYGASGLSAGDYTLTFTAPTGYTIDQSLDTSWSVAEIVTSAQTTPQDATASSTVIPPGDLAGHVTDDGSGSGVSGVTVSLADYEWTPVATTTTDSSGGYSFVNLTPGVYNLTFTSATGRVFDQSSTTTWWSQVVVSSTSTTTQDAQTHTSGVAQPGGIAGVVTDDATGGGAAGVQVTLYDSVWNLLQTTSTNSTGQYSFTSLTPGGYILEFLQPLSDDVFDASGQLIWATGETVSSGQTLTQNATVSVPGTGTGSVVGTVTDDASQGGLAGVAVTLVSLGAGNISTTTNTSGQFEFDNLAPGGYTLEFTAPGSYQFDDSGSGTTAQYVTVMVGQQTSAMAESASSSGSNDGGSASGGDLGAFQFSATISGLDANGTPYTLVETGTGSANVSTTGNTTGSGSITITATLHHGAGAPTSGDQTTTITTSFDPTASGMVDGFDLDGLNETQFGIGPNAASYSLTIRGGSSFQDAASDSYQDSPATNQSETLSGNYKDSGFDSYMLSITGTGENRQITIADTDLDRYSDSSIDTISLSSSDEKGSEIDSNNDSGMDRETTIEVGTVAPDGTTAMTSFTDLDLIQDRDVESITGTDKLADPGDAEWENLSEADNTTGTEWDTISGTGNSWNMSQGGSGSDNYRDTESDGDISSSSSSGNSDSLVESDFESDSGLAGETFSANATGQGNTVTITKLSDTATGQTTFRDSTTETDGSTAGQDVSNETVTATDNPGLDKYLFSIKGADSGGYQVTDSEKIQDSYTDGDSDGDIWSDADQGSDWDNTSDRGNQNDSVTMTATEDSSGNVSLKSLTATLDDRATVNAGDGGVDTETANNETDSDKYSDSSNRVIDTQHTVLTERGGVESATTDSTIAGEFDGSDDEKSVTPDPSGGGNDVYEDVLGTQDLATIKEHQDASIGANGSLIPTDGNENITDNDGFNETDTINAIETVPPPPGGTMGGLSGLERVVEVDGGKGNDQTKLTEASQNGTLTKLSDKESITDNLNDKVNITPLAGGTLSGSGSLSGPLTAHINQTGVPQNGQFVLSPTTGDDSANLTANANYKQDVITPGGTKSLTPRGFGQTGTSQDPHAVPYQTEQITQYSDSPLQLNEKDTETGSQVRIDSLGLSDSSNVTVTTIQRYYNTLVPTTPNGTDNGTDTDVVKESEVEKLNGGGGTLNGNITRNHIETDSARLRWNLNGASGTYVVKSLNSETGTTTGGTSLPDSETDTYQTQSSTTDFGDDVPQPASVPITMDYNYTLKSSDNDTTVTTLAAPGAEPVLTSVSGGGSMDDQYNTTTTGPKGVETDFWAIADAWTHQLQNGQDETVHPNLEKFTTSAYGTNPFTGATVYHPETVTYGPPLQTEHYQDWFSAISNFSAAVGDKVSLGLTQSIRQGLGYDDVVDYNSRAYKNGEVAGEVLSVAVQNLTPCRAVGLARAGLRVLHGVQAAGNTVQAAQSFSQGDIIGGLFSLQSARSSYGSMLRSCFVAGTPLLTPDGSKAIEQFSPGDLVLSRDEHDPTAPVVARRVLQTLVRTGFVLYLEVGGRKIGTTTEHPFYVKGRGWKPAGELRAGDVLLTHDGREVPVQEIEETGRVETVYNLEVDESHTYFVGSAEWGFSVWSHNRDCFVYQEVVQGVYKYIGITYNFAKRASNHRNQSGGRIIELIPGLGMLTRKDARAIEHLLIEKIGRVKDGTGTLLNDYAGIKPRNLKNYTTELAAWRVKLAQLGLL
jgi:5-hydroxyisourate hydrolase-like protein (transthyretin family)